jgi:hypothetical protein
MLVFYASLIYAELKLFLNLMLKPVVVIALLPYPTPLAQWLHVASVGIVHRPTAVPAPVVTANHCTKYY